MPIWGLNDTNSAAPDEKKRARVSGRKPSVYTASGTWSRGAVKVYLQQAGEKRCIGRADVPDDAPLLISVPLFGGSSIIREHFEIGTVTHLPAGGGTLIVERAVVLAPGQLPELLPGWQPLAS